MSKHVLLACLAALPSTDFALHQGSQEAALADVEADTNEKNIASASKNETGLLKMPVYTNSSSARSTAESQRKHKMAAVNKIILLGSETGKNKTFFKRMQKII